MFSEQHRAANLFLGGRASDAARLFLRRAFSAFFPIVLWAFVDAVDASAVAVCFVVLRDARSVLVFFRSMNLHRDCL